MRRIILNIACSLDGYIARENGSIDWLPTDGGDFGMKKFIDSVDTVILGRTTYEQILTFDCDYPYANKKSYIFSTKPGENTEGIKFVSDIMNFSKKLVELPGKNIWLVGGGKIISFFLNAGLIDEIILSKLPISIGRGIPLFQNINQDIKFDIVETINYPELVQIRLRVHNDM